MLDHTTGPAYTLNVDRLFSRTVTEYEWRPVTVDFKSGTMLPCRVPVTWSDNAAATLMSKYAVRAGVPDNMGGVNGREVDAERIFDRLVAGWRDAAIRHGYWEEDDPSLAVFCDEIHAMLEQQRAAPNSPQWFNTGVAVQYGIKAGSDGHYYATVGTDGESLHACSDSLTHPQISACFIQSVGDNLVGEGGIMDLWTREARLFKYGSGSGANYSALRGKGEPLSRGGASSGLLSFLRVGDRSAGAVKSGGTCLAPWQRVYTARGPVAVKELAEAGEDFIVVSYDPPAGRYMAKTARAWLAGNKQVVKITTDKGEFFMSHDHPVRLSCGTVRRASELVAGNSLFRCSIDNRAGYTRVHLRNGAKGKESLHRLVAADVMQQDLTGLVVHHVDGDKQNNTPSNLQIMTQAEHAGDHNREIAAQGDHVFQQRVFPKPGEANGMHASSAFWQDPEKVEAYRLAQSKALTKSGRAAAMAHEASRQRMLNTAFKVLNAGLPIDTFDDYIRGRKQVVGRIPSIRQTRNLINDRFGDYKAFVAEVSANNHRVVSVDAVAAMDVYDVEVDCPTPDDKSPESGHNFVIWPDDSHAGSGIVVFNTRRSARMVIVDVDHPDVEEFIGWKANEDDKIRALHKAGYGDPSSFEDDATETVSGQNANNSVAVTDAFMHCVDEDIEWYLTNRVDGKVAKTVNARDLWGQIADAAWRCADPGLQFADTINAWHTCPADGPIRAANPCSEYVFIDDTACNLASINLAKFHDPERITTHGFDWTGYEHAVRLWTIVLDISVSMAGYPTAEIARRSMQYRTLGLGYAALGEVLVLAGLGYGTQAGRGFAAMLTSMLTGVAYRTSTELARRLGAFPRFDANREHVLAVIQKHGTQAGESIAGNALSLWLGVMQDAARYGVRNAQVSLLAPCGTIGIVMDCETTGVEPYYSDTTIKTLAGGGTMRLATKRFADAIRTHGHDPYDYMRYVWTVESGRVLEYAWLEPPAELADVLVCASDLTPQQHIDMMAAAQPFLSGAISKTVNMPGDATVEDVACMYKYAWTSGLKSIAIYRDGCKPAQPLQGRKPAPGVQTFPTREIAETFAVAATNADMPSKTLSNPAHVLGDAKRGVVVDTLITKLDYQPAEPLTINADEPRRGERVDPPSAARAVKHRVELSGHTFYLVLTEHADGSLAEVFVTCSRTGSAIAGWVNAWAKLFSLALQHGTPLDVLVSAMSGESFEPGGYHDGRPVLSPVDCFARIIEARYLAEPDAPAVEAFVRATPFTKADIVDARGKPTGQHCDNCGSANLVRSGACFVCRKCGSTTGCS